MPLVLQHTWDDLSSGSVDVSIYSPSNEQPPSSLRRGSGLCSQRLLLTHPECWLQSPPPLFSALRSPHGAEAPARSSPEPWPAGTGSGKGRLAGTLPAAGTFPAGSWELLHPSRVSCPQLSITARNAGDSSVLETERLRLNGSVTEHRLPEHSPGSSYAVMLRGLTAAGAGAALMREFHTGSSGKALLSRCPRSLGTDELCSAARLVRGCRRSPRCPADAHAPPAPLQTPRAPRAPSAAGAPATSPHPKARPCFPCAPSPVPGRQPGERSPRSSAAPGCLSPLQRWPADASLPLAPWPRVPATFGPAGSTS